jgi:hypothetical protein
MTDSDIFCLCLRYEDSIFYIIYRNPYDYLQKIYDKCFMSKQLNNVIISQCREENLLLCIGVKIALTP